MPESRAQVRYAHSVLAGKAKKKNGMPPAVAREIVGKMSGQSMYELPEKAGNPHPKKKRKRLFGPKKKVAAQGSGQVEDVTERMIAEGKERAGRVREAAAAIKAGRAEAHPIVEHRGFHGPVVMEEPEVREMGDIFTKSLVESYWRRNPRKRPPKMEYPDPGSEFAGLFGM